jgi:uncharacterized membrane protein (DUF4010 family)
LSRVISTAEIDMRNETLVTLLVSALGGAAVGLEREWSGHAEGDSARFAGLRTFTLLGLLGGVVGWLWTHGAPLLGGLLLAGAAGLVVVAYASASRRDIGGTTEVAALVVLSAGIMAGVGQIATSSAIIALSVLLLVEKTRLHAVVQLIDDEGFRAGVRFAVMALVVLPLLPEGPFGPFGGIKPRQLWLLVLLFSGLSFAGYIARTLVGDRYGYPVTGLMGGVVSSTSVTLTFSRLSRARPAEGRALAGGVLAACAVLYLRVAVAVVILYAPLLKDLAPLLAGPFLVGVAAVVVHVRRLDTGAESVAAPANPLQLGAALQMTLLFQFVLFVLHAAERWFGQAGISTSAMLLGLTDGDALTASISNRVAEGMSQRHGAVAIAIGIAANTCMKVALTMAIGQGAFRLRAASGLGAMILAGVVSIVVLTR